MDFPIIISAYVPGTSRCKVDLIRNFKQHKTGMNSSIHRLPFITLNLQFCLIMGGFGGPSLLSRLAYDHHCVL